MPPVLSRPHTTTLAPLGDSDIVGAFGDAQHGPVRNSATCHGGFDPNIALRTARRAESKRIPSISREHKMPGPLGTSWRPADSSFGTNSMSGAR